MDDFKRSRKERSQSSTVERLSDVREHVEYTVSNFGDTSDIAWNFLVGQAILDKAKELDISINMTSRIDSAKGEPRLYIGTACIELRPINSGDESPENQQNPKNELGT